MNNQHQPMSDLTNSKNNELKPIPTSLPLFLTTLISGESSAPGTDEELIPLQYSTTDQQNNNKVNRTASMIRWEFTRKKHQTQYHSISTTAPTASIAAFNFSDSSFDTSTFSVCGKDSTNFLACTFNTKHHLYTLRATLTQITCNC